jgi:hypothetical protein
MIVALLVALAAASPDAAPSSAPAAAPAAPAATTAAANPAQTSGNTIVCKTEAVTGSMFPKKVCRKKSEADALRGQSPLPSTKLSKSGMARFAHLPATALLLALAAPLAAHAKDKAPADRAPAFQAVLNCRGIADNAQRLACYDAAAGGMGDAERHGDIMVIDRAQATAANREAFGLSMPTLAVITKALTPDEVNKVEGVVDSVRADINGRWTFVLEGGQIWRQISGDLYKAPKHGSKVMIRHGSLDSFLMNVDGQPSIKVHRDQ